MSEKMKVWQQIAAIKLIYPHINIDKIEQYILELEEQSNYKAMWEEWQNLKIPYKDNCFDMAEAVESAKNILIEKYLKGGQNVVL